MEKKTLETVERAATAEAKPLTPAENLVLTAKILVGGGALIGTIWALDHYVR